MDWLKLKFGESLAGKQPLSKKALITLGALVAGVVFFINLLNGGGGPTAVVSQPTASDIQIEPGKIFVHLVGEVQQPGIYELDSGARVVDAIFAASGFTERAEQASVNLAREVSDGEQIVIFKVGESSLVGGGVVGSVAAGGASPINLNRASQLELETLPGVGPALAGRIIDWRLANGGFKKKEDLLSISGIGDKLFTGLKNLVAL